MTEPVLVDTGPLVALLNQRDEHHHRSVAAFSTLRQPPLTCWPVLTEVVWLLRPWERALRVIFSMLRAGDLRVCDLDPQAAEYLESFVLRYPTSDLTDASLMYLAERDSRDAVLTLDRRDFLVYRTTDGRALELLP